MRHLPSVVVCLLLLSLAACGGAPPEPAAPAATSNAAAEASTEVATAAGEATAEMPAEATTAEVATPDLPTVLPILETRSIVDAEERPGGEAFGDADDPAIWLHPSNPSQSLVITVLKEGGLDVYDLEGQVLQSLTDDGIRYNNVDLIYGFSLNGTPTDLAVASDRYKDNLAVFAIDPATRNLSNVSDPEMKLIFTPDGQESDEETTAYGIATYKSASSGKFYAFVNRRATGELAQLELVENGGKVSYTKIRTLTLPTPEGAESDEDAQTEGMVVDPELGFVYIGQENVGIWKFTAEPDSGDEGKLIHEAAPKGPYLQADVEGLTIYYTADGKGYLLSSSQGDNTFAVFTREGDNTYIGSFQVGENGGIDGVQECDGAQVLSLPLGERFPQGLLIIQDGQNDPPVMVEDDGEMENANTNFKFVSWADVANAFNPPLMIDTTSYSPR